MKYEAGDKVKIIGNKAGHCFDLGTIVAIVEIDNIRDRYRGYGVDETEKKDYWWVYKEDIAPLYYTWEDFLKCPIGTKVTFESGEILVKVRENENQFRDGSVFRDYEDLEYFRDNLSSKPLGKIIKIEEPTYTTVYKPTEEVEEMTMEEVCKALGKQIKIVKEKSND